MSSMISKLILGTAGLGGLPYGRQGKVVSKEDTRQIIQQACSRGIRVFDTAPTYGWAEQALGEALQGYTDCVVYTKTQGSWEEAVESIKRLRPHMPRVLFHNYARGMSRVFPPWANGATVYNRKDLPGDGEIACFDVLQFPWNLLRQDFFTADVKIARSVFLQGLLKDPFPKGIYSSPEIEVAILKADRLAHALGVNIQTLALRSALEMNFDGVVIGPQSIEELEECIAIAEMKPLNALPFIKELDLGDNPITDPRTWAA